MLLLFQLLFSRIETRQVVWKIGTNGWISSHGWMASICFLNAGVSWKCVVVISVSLYSFKEFWKKINTKVTCSMSTVLLLWQDQLDAEVKRKHKRPLKKRSRYSLKTANSHNLRSTLDQSLGWQLACKEIFKFTVLFLGHLFLLKIFIYLQTHWN